MSGGEWAALIAALAFVALVAFLSMMLLKVHAVLTSTQLLVQDIRHSTVPILDELKETLTSVNAELDRVDGILGAAESAATSVSSVTRLVTSAASNPLIKGLAFLAGAGASARSIRKRKRKE